jgi:hypothetical protein
MAGSVAANPGFDLTPTPSKVAIPSNYITSFDFLSQYLPDTFEKEFERYGNRSIASFLRMVGAESPSNSDLIKWSEQGRLHTKYEGVTESGFSGNVSDDFTVAVAACTFRVGQTVVLSSASKGITKKAIITSLPTATKFRVAYYENISVDPFAGAYRYCSITFMVLNSEKELTEWMEL